MPPKRKTQKSARGQPAHVVNVDETAEQTLRETFDVASLPMNEGGADISQQRQQEFRSPAASQRSDRRKGAKKRRPSPSSGATGTGRHGHEERDETEKDGEQRQQHEDTAGETRDASLGEITLTILVQTGAASTPVDRLLNVYRSGEQATALCAILNLVAKAAGVQDVELDSNALADGVDISPLLEELYARVPMDSAAYLLANKDPKYRRFPNAFSQFAETLIKLAWSCDVLRDEILLPTLAQWVISMSESKLRSFRHTATVMLLGFVQGFNGLYTDLKERLTLSRTRKETTDLEGKMEELARWRDHFFSQAIHQRLRDVAPEIRLCVFRSLRRWVCELPDEFMTNKYLRYFGMPLHDKRPELRAEGLNMIWLALCDTPGAYSRMHLFLQYFTTRLVEMSNDVDVRCAELAIRVVAMMVRGDSEATEGNELLQDTMIDRVLLSLFDERPTIRGAAGMLLKVFIHCRTAGEETEEEELRVATELLSSFARTLRTLYEERMPEKYLVDALWTPERLPLLLTEYKPMLEAARTAEGSTDAVVGLSLLTALLEKARGRLTLGPPPKDDRKGSAAAARKLPRSTQETVEDLSRSVSVDLGAALLGIMERFRGDQQVLCAAARAVAALDLDAFASEHQTSELEGIMLELRKATLSATGSDSLRDALVEAWHALAFTAHPQRSSAQAHVGFLVKQILQQVVKVQEAVAATAAASPSLSQQQTKRGAAAAAKAAADDAVNVWSRLCLISSLAPTTEHWPVVQAALARQLDSASNVGGSEHERDAGQVVGTEDDAETARVFELLEWMMETAVNGVLWRINALQTAANDDAAGNDTPNAAATTAAAEIAVRENMANVVAVLLQCLSAGDGVLRSGATSTLTATIAALVSLRSKAAVHLCDLAALRFYDMPQVEQEALVNAFDSLFEYWSAQLRVAQDTVKAAVSQRQETTVLSQVANARQHSSHMEASQMRLTIGVARLLVLKRMEAALAPRVLVQWTQTTSKAVSDTFKGLFHTMRDRTGDAFHLERDILLTAYARCAEVGATPVSVDALYQTGAKLASVHFTATDRYYPAVVAMVQFAAEFAASTDPLLLQGIVPYCSKLRTADALHLVRQKLATQDIFMNPTNPYVRAFIAAMRKAAKLEEYLSGSSAAAVSQARASTSAVMAGTTGVKRPRELLNGGPEDEGDDHLLAEIARSVSDGAGGGGGGVRESRTSAAHTGGGHRPAAKAARTSQAGRASVAARVVTEDGWRELPSSQPVSVSLTPQELVTGRKPEISAAGSQRRDDRHAVAGARRREGARGAVDMPTSQEMAMSSLADGIDTEAFIGTEDFE